MSITGSLQIGRSALTVAQAALSVAGNNMANAATPGFNRRSVLLTPMRGDLVGNNQYVGRGVDLVRVKREMDVSLQARLRQATSDQQRSLIDQRFLTSIETIQNELSDNDLSSLLSDFFNAFSEVANNPEDNAIRSVAIQQGVSLASRVSDMNSDYADLRLEADRALGDAVEQADELLSQIAFINQQVADAENVGGEASALRDQRDMLVDELSQFIDVNVVEQSNGTADVFIRSVPVVLGSNSRGITLEKKSVAGELQVQLRVDDDGTFLETDTGTIGGLLGQRNNTIDPAIDAINEFAAELIFQVNRLHSQGQARVGFESVAGTYRVTDPTANLNSIAAELPFNVQNGSFTIQVTNQDSGLAETYQINVDGNAHSLNDIIADINANVPNLTAGVNTNGNLTLDSNSGFEFSFLEDTTGFLAATGINSFFTGHNATTIDVNQVLLDDASMLAVGAGGIAGSNNTAIAIAELQNNGLDALDGRSLRDFWQSNVNQLAARTSAANQKAQSAAIVRESINAQMQSVSGVSLDEESVNMMLFQRQYQAAARFITVIDETMQTLLSIA